MDFDAVIKYINKKFNNPSLYAVGISMGANLLNRFVENTGVDCPFKAVVCMSGPYNLDVVTQQLTKDESMIYNDPMIDSCREILVNNYKFLKMNVKQHNIDVDALINLEKLRDYDKYFVSRINGFKTIDDFYMDISSCHYIKDIKIPTLFIHSLDDPVCIKECIPIEDIIKNENCILMLTQKGGHIEWFTGNKPYRWAYIPTLEYLTYHSKLNGDKWK